MCFWRGVGIILHEFGVHFGSGLGKESKKMVPERHGKTAPTKRDAGR